MFSKPLRIRNHETDLIFNIIFNTIVRCTKSYIQIFDTNGLNSKLSDGFWVFETDTIKGTYSFWASQGVMSFSIYNKMDAPIYIDWKNSSFIYNSNKLNYWIDEQHSKLVSYYGGYYYNGPLLMPGFTITEGVKASMSTTTRPERVTFIPPRSYYNRSQFYLMPIDYFKFDNNAMEKKIVPRFDKPQKNTTIYELNYGYVNTPLKFRNFITVSFSENTSNYFFIDNEFYLSSVKELEYWYYRGNRIKGKDGKIDYTKPYKKMHSFYIKIPPGSNVEYRKY